MMCVHDKEVLNMPALVKMDGSSVTCSSRLAVNVNSVCADCG